jgi:hypothetical protein
LDLQVASEACSPQIIYEQTAYVWSVICSLFSREGEKERVSFNVGIIYTYEEEDCVMEIPRGGKGRS